MAFKFIVAGLGAFLAIAGTTASAQTAFERSGDKAVTKLVDSLADNLKEYRGALDKDFKRSVVRTPTGEADVEHYLDDLQEATKTLGDRFNDKYAASAEVSELLKRAVPANTYMREHPTLKGASEWDRFAGDLNRLATAYGASFPPAANAVIRRIGDGELLQSLGSLEKVGKTVGNPLSKAAKSVPELATVVGAGTAGLDSLGAAAKTLRSRVDRGEPATAEARQVQALAAKLDPVFAHTGMPATVKTLWQGSRTEVDKVLQAFGLTAGTTAAAPAAAAPPAAAPTATAPAATAPAATAPTATAPTATAPASAAR
ncbi:MAG TPA: hypothetical protein VE907_12500 [Gammaproteobacteria bacterium]|nr:hypothetical protein [Gammaproteobacteria bacterium]